jgi:hypothetical protein
MTGQPAADMGLASKYGEADREAFDSKEVYRMGHNVDGPYLERWGRRTRVVVVVGPSCLEVGAGGE